MGAELPVRVTLVGRVDVTSTRKWRVDVTSTTRRPLPFVRAANARLQRCNLRKRYVLPEYRTLILLLLQPGVPNDYVTTAVHVAVVTRDKTPAWM